MVQKVFQYKKKRSLEISIWSKKTLVLVKNNLKDCMVEKTNHLVQYLGPIPVWSITIPSEHLDQALQTNET